MTEDGRPDPLGAPARPLRRRAGAAALVLALIAGGIVAGARLGQPVRRAEQRVTDPIREAVARSATTGGLPDLVEAACPAVVTLSLPGGRGRAAQGVLVTGDGDVVTTAPVPMGATLEARLNDGRRLAATVAARDPRAGLALLKLDGEDFASLALAEPDLPRIGAWGFLLAAPAGKGCRVVPGAIAADSIAEGATGDYYLRVAAPGFAPAGAPFLDADGRVLGLARQADADGQARFVPADLLAALLGQLLRDDATAPDRFGLFAEDLAPRLTRRLGAVRERGAVIVLVGAGSAAAKAGLEVGDIVLSAGGAPISSASELARALGDRPVDLTLLRDGAETSATLVPAGVR